MSRFSEFIVSERKKRGWSQLTLSVEADVSTATIANYELGLFEPTLRVIRKIAKALEVDTNVLTEMINYDKEHSDD